MLEELIPVVGLYQAYLLLGFKPYEIDRLIQSTTI